MPEKDDKTTTTELRREIGARIKKVRSTVFKLSQRKFAEQMDHVDLGANPQNRLANLEQGNGSATIIFGVLSYLYNEGININYLFGPEQMRRTTDGTVLYAENITDYLDEATRNLGETREKVDELLQATYEVREYIKGTIQMNTDT